MFWRCFQTRCAGREPYMAERCDCAQPTVPRGVNEVERYQRELCGAQM
jgi:hypothetical protein